MYYYVVSGFGNLEGVYRSLQAARRRAQDITPGVNWLSETLPRVRSSSFVPMNEDEDSTASNAQRRAEHCHWGKVER